MDSNDGPAEAFRRVLEMADLVIDGLALIGRNTNIDRCTLGWHAFKFSQICQASSSDMSDLSSPSGDSNDLIGMMQYGLVVMRGIIDGHDDLNGIIKRMADRLQVEPAAVEKVMRLVLDSRQSR